MEYRARELVTTPGLLSLSRIPLAVAFVLLIDRPPLACAVLVLAAVTDLLDGWAARRRGLASATGAALDPITDKLFVATVAIALLVSGKLSAPSVLLISTRELGELPLVLWFLRDRRWRRGSADHPKANLPGKLATAVQFVTIAWALFEGPALTVWIALAAGAGLLAAISYWRRALQRVRRADHTSHK